MADQMQLAKLREGVEAWNQWRLYRLEAHLEVNLSNADLRDVDLREVDLYEANLRWANLTNANLRRADLAKADLLFANLRAAKLSKAQAGLAHLHGADLTKASLIDTNLKYARLIEANLTGADLHRARLPFANLRKANLAGANLRKANLAGADLTEANLAGADLTEANLSMAKLVRTSFVGANLTGCQVYGVSAWNLRLDGATQFDLRITPAKEPEITVDNLEVAQFLYLLLHNERIRDVIDTITSKVVLILGRFSSQRKPVLDALRGALRNHPNSYIPVLFDFEPQYDKPVLETVKILASLARFVIVDLTDPNMVRSEVTYITANLPTVPVQPVILSGASLPTEYETWTGYRSFLKIYRYTDQSQLLADLTEEVVSPVERHVVARRLGDADSN